MSYICSSCGKIAEDRKVKRGSKVYPGHLCQGCYLYFSKGGVINEIPPKGIIAKDDRGYVICHICGRAYKRLGSHIRESHQMTIAEYKEEFGLCNRSKTTENQYHNLMKEYAEIYSMSDRLKESGKATRIKDGEKDKRLGKPVRLQERLERSIRLSVKNKP